MKIENIINETTAGATASGSVAAVAKPMGETQKRGKMGPKVSGLEPAGKVMFGKAKKKGPYTNSISESAIKEDELSEEDMFLMRAEKPKVFGFIPKGKSRVDHEVEMARSDLIQAMKNAKTVYGLIKDRSEDEGLEGWVQEKIIKAADYLNTIAEYLEGKKVQEMQGGVVAAGGVGEAYDPTTDRFFRPNSEELRKQRRDLLAKSGSVGYDNAKAIAYAVKDGTSADIKLGDDTVTLEYPEARFAYGVYKQALKSGRVDEIIKVFADPIKFHKMMKKMGDMLYRDRSKEMAAAAAQRIGPSVVNEKAVSKAQQKFMGMVHAVQKGEMKAPNKEVAKVAKGMSKKAGHDFAATKHKGLPEKVKKD